MRTVFGPHRTNVPAARLALVAVALALPLGTAACGGGSQPTPTSASSASSSAAGTSGTTTVATTTGAATTASTSTASTTSCAFPGATTAPGDTALSSLTVSGVQASAQPCFDRVVIEMSGTPSTKPGYQARYVPQVTQDGSGEPITLRGRAFLSVSVGAPAYNASGQPTFIPANKAEVADVKGLTSIQQIAWAGSFEGTTTIGIGVSEKLPFTVQVTQEGGKVRLVLDIAHQG